MIPPLERQISDDFGYVETLRMVLQDPALHEQDIEGSLSPEARSAILLLAQTIGYCRLFSIAIPSEIDGSLPVATALSAGGILLNVLSDALLDADEYAERWERCSAQEEMELLATDLLRVRMHAWAVFVAIDEGAVAAGRDEDPATEQLEHLVTELVDAIQQFDLALRRDDELLISALNTNVIENWRSMLGDDYQAALPWWLDGTLEKTAGRIQRAMETPATHSGNPAPDSAQDDVEGLNLWRYVMLQSVPAANFAGNLYPSCSPPSSSLEWQSPTDLSGMYAVLQIPLQRDPSGTTLCRMEFRGPVNETLAGLPASLGSARAIIQRCASSDAPEAVVVEAVFVLEQLKLQDGQFSLLIQGQRWIET